MQPSKKPRPPELAPSRRPKLLVLQPSGMPRPRGPPRPSYSTGQHGKVMQDLEEQVIQEEGRSQTDFLSACQAALHASPVELKGVLVASYHILLGQAPMSHPFALSQRTSPAEEQSAPASPPAPVPSGLLGPKGSILPQILWTAHLWAETMSKTTLEGPPAPNLTSERSHLGTRHSSRATQKCSAKTLIW